MQKKAIAEFHMGSMQAKKLEIFTNPEYQNPKEGGCNKGSKCKA